VVSFHHRWQQVVRTAVARRGDHGRWDSIGPGSGPECEEGGGAFIDAVLQASARNPASTPGRPQPAAGPAAGQSTRRRNSKAAAGLCSRIRVKPQGSRLRHPGPHLFRMG